MSLLMRIWAYILPLLYKFLLRIIKSIFINSEEKSGIEV